MTTTQESAVNGQPTEPDHRPKALRYGPIVQQVEQMMVEALPTIVAKLISMASEGDMAAAKYVMDRILGRTAKLALAPAGDNALAYTHLEWSLDQLKQKAENDAIADRCLATIFERTERQKISTQQFKKALRERQANRNNQR